MSLQQSVGASMHYSAALPATHDADGFAALTFTKVGRLNSLPDLDGTRDIATFDDLELGTEEKFGDVFRAGGSTFTIGLDDGDDGQALLNAAAISGDKGSMKVVLKDGTIYNRTCIVTSMKPTGIATGNIVTAECGMEFEKTTVKVEPVALP